MEGSLRATQRTRLGAQAATWVRDLTVRDKPPLGPPSFHQLSAPRQGASHPRRARRCLLKDCERWFTPAYPQSRYCSGRCCAAARRWRRAQASRRYRASAGGRERRRAQHQRHRQRQRERAAAVSTELPAAREGQRPASPGEDFAECMCARPGCYVTFWVNLLRSNRRFCSLACRLALRRVLDREARYRQRRRRWRRERMTRPRSRLDTS